LSIGAVTIRQLVSKVVADGRKTAKRIRKVGKLNDDGGTTAKRSQFSGTLEGVSSWNTYTIQIYRAQMI
jgi:hypothetical protein